LGLSRRGRAEDLLHDRAIDAELGKRDPIRLGSIQKHVQESGKVRFVVR